MCPVQTESEPAPPPLGEGGSHDLGPGGVGVVGGT